MWKKLWSLPIEALLLVGVSVPLRAAASPSVNVALKASFNAAPLLVELLETAAEENSTAYFPLLDRIADGRFDKTTTDRELYDTFLKVLQDDGFLNTPEAVSSFQLALSIHSAAPRIEAHYQFYQSSVEPALVGEQSLECDAWVALDGKQYCSSGLDQAHSTVQQAPSQDRSITTHDLPFDRVLEGSSTSSPHVLYADISSPAFREYHKALSDLAKTPKGSNAASYRVRYKPSKTAARKPLDVRGYGVELALKRTDYIVIDDREAQEAQEKAPESASSKPADGKLQDEEIADLKPLSSSEVSYLGMKAASFVMDSENPLDMLLRLSQDFPKHSSSISARNASAEFEMEHSSNHLLGVPAGFNVLWINGQQIDPRKIDAFSLLDHLRRERKYIEGIKDLGFSGPDAIAILSSEAITETQSDDEPQRYDWRDEAEGGNVIMWLNNIEKDKRYADWPASITALLQRTYPGQMPSVRKDIHNCIIPVDFSDKEHVEMVVEHLQNFVRRKIPVQFGVVPMTDSKASTSHAKVVYHLLKNYGLGVVMKYLENSISLNKLSSPDEKIFDVALEGKPLRKDGIAQSLEEVLDAEDLLSHVEGSKKYLARLAVDRDDASLFINGAPVARDESWIQKLSSQISSDMRIIQGAVASEEFEEDAWVPQHWIDQAALRRNRLIIPEDEKNINFVDLKKIYGSHKEAMENLPRIPAGPLGDEDEWSHLIVIGDFSSTAGSRLMYEVLKSRETHSLVEVTFLHNSGNREQGTDMSEELMQLLLSEPHTEFVNLWSTLGHSAQVEQTALRENFLSKVSSTPSALQGVIREDFKLEPGQLALVINGRMVGPIPEHDVFTTDDVDNLHVFELEKRIRPAVKAISDLSLSDRLSSPLATAMISSSIAISTIPDVPSGIFTDFPTQRMSMFEQWASDFTAIKLGDRETASIQIVACLDPASEHAQRWTPIFKVLSELSGVYLKVFLNPKDTLEELPVKRFYRYVLDSKPSFDENGSFANSGAVFGGLPAEALLTMGMDVPAPWLVAPKESVHDLDNIKLSNLQGHTNIEATYELENILIEGHSRDLTAKRPPRGAQLMLGTEKEPYKSDTIIMANLGYFQFKANPGFYKIQLRPGRSEEIFHIDSLGTKGYQPQPGDETTEIALTSFQGLTLFPRLSRNPGMESEDVLAVQKTPLEELAAKGTDMAQNVLGDAAAEFLVKGFSIGSNLLSKAGLGGPSTESRHADINIFSVASGHLYERMLNIMMVSVMRHTTHSVKFWFIEQFLSPSFKSFLPTLAAAYGFRYEMVTYKWPHWLRAQKEKQREIWGYKILFLDVLFPQDLDRVLFVDADQIVRADMYELTTLDLHGAPYGFTPMCDSRTEMEGFRFWKQGYWAKALRGRPYHISALYAVDLARFRALAAGDRLRQHYHQLSADPQSLSNLDQDLPNSMQAMLPMHSLPQEWLWCETWCADEALATAKTIDLCNNPLTKEPKLERARRQVPEWTVYDEEIAALARRERSGEGQGAAHVVAEESVKEGDEGKTADEGKGEETAKPAHARDEL